MKDFECHLRRLKRNNQLDREEGWRDGPSHVGTCTHGWLTTTQFLLSVFVVENAANVPDRRIVSRTIRPEIYTKRGEKWFSHRLNTIIHKNSFFLLILEATLRYITLSGLSLRAISIMSCDCAIQWPAAKSHNEWGKKVHYIYTYGAGVHIGHNLCIEMGAGAYIYWITLHRRTPSWE